MKLSNGNILKLRKVIEPRIWKFSEVTKWIDYIEIRPTTNGLSIIGDLDKSICVGILTDVKNFVTTYGMIGFESYARHTLTSKYGLKLKILLHPVRVSITGKTISLPLFEVMDVLTNVEIIRRLEHAIKEVENVV